MTSDEKALRELRLLMTGYFTITGDWRAPDINEIEEFIIFTRQEAREEEHQAIIEFLENHNRKELSTCPECKAPCGDYHRRRCSQRREGKV